MTKEDTEQKTVRELAASGDYNLFILGIICVVIAVITSGISLYLYHSSGDIYLDRSRPGFLPDEQESSSKVNSDYKFGDSGPVDDAVLREYLQNFDDNLDVLDALESPFAASSLSDESLGIPAEEPTEPAEEAQISE